jgi:PAS domain S-box-containing protein
MSDETSPTILFVDDNEASRGSLSGYLRQSGFEVLEAGTGNAALRLVAEHPQLVLLDINLPDLDGFEVCRRIKADPSTAAIPVVHLSGYSVSSSDRAHGLEGGADSYLTKPVDPEEVVAQMRALLRTRLAEEAARRAAQQWQATFDAVSDGLCVLDRDGRVQRCNRALAEWLGPPPEGGDLRQWLGAALGESLAAVLALVRPAPHHEALEVPAHGRWFRVSVDPVRDPAGAWDGAVVLWSDVTDHREAEQALRASEAKYRTLFASNPQPMWVYDTQTLRFLAVNDAAVAHYGYSRAEFLAMTIKDIRPASDVAALEANLARPPRPLDRSGVWRHRRRDGSIREVETTSHAIGFEGRPARLVLVNDVTEQRRLEEQLRQAQKMEAVGQLAGGIAHDFNNLLTAILGNVSLLRAEPGELGQLDVIEKAALRAADLTGNLLGFARVRPMRLVPTQLAEVLSDTVLLLRPVLGPLIRLVVDTLPALWPVKTDPGPMGQVLMNLCLNSRDAMPQGGTLRLSATNVTLTPAEAGRQLDARPGDFVRLRVADTGGGMPPDVLKRVFEPFFTTKPPGQGTGLGLAMVYGIVKQLRGWVECQSAVGEGTTFDVYLPRLERSEASKAAEAAPQPVRGRGELVLLVDDEEMIRNLGRAVLEQYGYRAILAEDGLQALELYERHRGEIGVVILDLTMPKLPGRDAMRRLKQLDPVAKVILSSGYSSVLLDEEDRRLSSGFVTKPYQPAELARRVREVLDAAPPTPPEATSA